MRVAAVIVNYFNRHFLEKAVDSLLRESVQLGVELSILVVDNGSTAEERYCMSSLPVTVIGPTVNRGYAGGLNAGIASIEADVYLAMNADLEFLPDSLKNLIAAIKNGAHVAGPRFFWDKGQAWILPPTERRDLVSTALRKLESKCGILQRAAIRHWREHAWKHWQAKEAFASFNLSGALLAISKEAIARVGPFDEEYKLYFEENDWLERARIRGMKSVYVPAAGVLHYYNRSARNELQANSWFCESQRRFEERYLGMPALLLGRLAAILPDVPAVMSIVQVDSAAFRVIDRGNEDRQAMRIYVELSPNKFGYPAVRREIRCGQRWNLPQECFESMPETVYFARFFNEKREELKNVIIKKDESAPQLEGADLV